MVIFYFIKIKWRVITLHDFMVPWRWISLSMQHSFNCHLKKSVIHASKSKLHIFTNYNNFFNNATVNMTCCHRKHRRHPAPRRSSHLTPHLHLNFAHVVSPSPDLLPLGSHRFNSFWLRLWYLSISLSLSHLWLTFSL